MQNFALVTCRHTTVPLLLQTVKNTLDQIAADPKTKHFTVHTMQLVPAVEMPEQKVVSMAALGQPQMVFYASILLVAQAPAAPEKKELSFDDLKEIEEIKAAAMLVCKHKHLQPEKLYKGYRGPDHWYQVCADCGAEVWNDRASEYNQHVVNGKMVMYLNHPGECEHKNLANVVIIKRDAGGYIGKFQPCKDCGSEVYIGVPDADELDQYLVADLKNKNLDTKISIDPIGDQVNAMADRREAWQHDGEDV